MELLSKNKLIILLVIIILILTGCNDSLVIDDFVIESEFYNKAGYFIGNTKVEFTIKLVQEVLIEGFNQGLDYKWSSNGGEILSQKQNKIIYLTPQIPGDYYISVIITDRKDQEINYKFPFAVRGSYPEKVTLKEVENRSIESGNLIRWSSYMKDDFYVYKILRSNNLYIDNNLEVIAEIGDPKLTSYIDYEIEGNQYYTYQIMVINKLGYFSLSNEKMIETWSKGIKEIAIEDNLIDIVKDPKRTRCYISNKGQKQLLVLDSKREKIIKRIQLDIIPKKLILSKDNNFIFTFSPDSKQLIQIDLITWKIHKYNFDEKIIDVAIGNKYAYLNVKGEYNLLKLDIKEKKIDDRFKLSNKGRLLSVERVIFIRDKYLLIDEVFGDVLIYSLDDLSQPISNLGILSIKKLILSSLEEKDLLYIITEYPDYVKVVGIDKDFNLNFIENLTTDSYPRDFAFDNQNNLLFVVGDDKSIYTFSIKDNTLVDRVSLKNYIYQIDLDIDNKKIYLLTSSSKLTKNNIVIINYE
ncbi:hypothetical protein U472_07695 [Orenia metallireducens]|jgi:DNA-binding beta-propeller fold protein YncE|uniref:Uncharacterized protein n=1 Tax=Orenia metallireducens TaxID=1413210 RepID=A0A1C0AAL6_9FIRM|nr:hypothetical protein [Orenia metallireducens]OCL27334.1 hypothetical protein U472_07695 [Orenia metallireducens]